MSMMENMALRSKVVPPRKTSICIFRLMSIYLMLAKADTPVGVTALGPISNLGKRGHVLPSGGGGVLPLPHLLLPPHCSSSLCKITLRVILLPATFGS
ncbi:hypothetical protein CEXT_194401 [Caerostris extrusa]|uniref:Uncharacterized protein n=1 Tax=Caerostris extrusa TaxID=172846 RepID=A0AAV4MK98_CAEEX|nr:hypothetical protein CEXT_194401 [Caerostris extrusa]